jgi:phage repressor protein C with HTH and peptisase S24 domain
MKGIDMDSLVNSKPKSQVFACLENTNQNCLMDKATIRRLQLRAWFEHRTLPEKEKSYLSQLINGKSSFGEKAARRIELDYGMNPGYLDQDAPTNGPHEPDDDFVPVSRVLLKVSAGVTGFRVEHLEGNGPPIFFRADWFAQKGYKAERLYALKVSGESMEPGLWDGDLIVINSLDVQPVDGEVFVANYEGEVIIKRLERNAGEWWLTSDNPRFKPKKCDEHAELIGKVIYKQSERI